MNTYSVEVLWHPGFELVVSLEAYVSAKLHKIVDLGASWRAKVRQGLPRDLANRFDSVTGSRDAEALVVTGQTLAWAWPSGDGTVEDFLHWASDVDIRELHFVTARSARPNEQAASDLENQKERAVELMWAWHQHYFSHVSPDILSGLSDEAQRQRHRATFIDAERLVEEVSCGIALLPAPSFSKVVLVPQYHARPWNLYCDWENTCSLLYPAEVLPAAHGEPPIRLVRLTKALDDANRLRILKLVAEGPLSFTEIARQMDLTKPTVHYHLVLLRAAGLLRVQTSFSNRLDGRYFLRRSALSDLSQDLQSYLGGVVT